MAHFEDLRILEGLEAVRLRPAMYLGSTDSRGLEQMLRNILGLSISQYIGGATRLSIDIEDTGWVTVEDDGPGVSIDPVPPHEQSQLELLFSRLLVGPITIEHPNSRVPVKHGPLQTTLSVVTALSHQLDIETRRDGVAYRLAFTAGSPLSSLTKVGPTTMRGTVVRYRPDEKIFDEGAGHDLEAIERRLIDVARLCSPLDVRFQGRSLQHFDGLSSWLREAAPELVKDTLLTAKGSVGDFDIEVAFAWRPRASASLVRSFVNYDETPEGGSHVRGLTVALENVIGAKRASRVKKGLAGLVGIVHVGTKWPTTQRGVPLEDKNVRDAVRDVVTRAINEAPWWWARLNTAIG